MSAVANVLEKKTHYAFVDFEREHVVDFSNAALNAYPAILRPYLSADLQNEMLSLRYRLERTGNEEGANLNQQYEQIKVNQRIFALRKMFEAANGVVKGLDGQSSQAGILEASEPFIKAWLLLYDGPLDLPEPSSRQAVMAVIHLAQDVLFAMKERAMERIATGVAGAEPLLAGLKQSSLLTLEKGTIKFLLMSWLMLAKKFQELPTTAGHIPLSDQAAETPIEGLSASGPTRVKQTLSAQVRKQAREKAAQEMPLPVDETSAKRANQEDLEEHLRELNAHWAEVSASPFDTLWDLVRNLQLLMLNLSLQILRPINKTGANQTPVTELASPSSGLGGAEASAAAKKVPFRCGFVPLLEKNIVFYNNFGKPLCAKRPYGVSKMEEDLALDMALEAIKQCANFVKEQPPVQSGFFQGRPLFDLMQHPQKQELMLFLGFVDKSPKSYIGKNYKISETYATWLANNAPLSYE